MVKKRLFLLVLLHVASILVICQGDNAEPSEDYPHGYFDENGEYVYFDESPIGYYNDDEFIYYDLPVGYVDENGEYVYYEGYGDYEDYTPEVFVVTRTVKYTKTTTTSEPMECEDYPEIIEAKAMVLSEPMEGFTHDQCEFVIVDEFCAWEYRCGAIITEPPLEEEEEDEDDDEQEGDPEECEQIGRAHV